MKKSIILFLAIGMFYFQQAHAQDFKFGFSVEPTLSWMTTSTPDVQSDGSNFGFRFGVIGENYFGDNFGITAGVRLGIGMGGSLKYRYGGRLLPESELTRQIENSRDDFPDNTSINYNLSVLELPFSFKMRSNQIGYINYFAEFPILSLGILTNAKGDITSSTINSEDENVIKDVSTIFLNWGVGAGMEYELSAGTSLVLGLYYMSSLSDMTTDDAIVNIPLDSGEVVEEPEESKGILRNISLRVGVKF
ncbi:MAG TPA: outer membrane beta-barrel protein [Saprospiraceae bacterium]|nr:outer membrane beta-barrel protein [Saprospiraceae bacterium]